jgi:hypothetical protein
MMAIIYIFVCLPFCPAAAEHIIFQEQQGVLNAKTMIHVNIDFDFSQIMSVCTDLRPFKQQFRKHLRPSCKSCRANNDALWHLADQACDMLQLWQQNDRPKRQAMLIGALIAGGIFTMYNKYTISKLAHRFDTLEQHVSHDLIRLRRDETRLASVQRDLDAFNTTINFELDNMRNTLLSEMYDWATLQTLQVHVATLHGHTSAIQRTWLALVSGHISTDLLDLSHLTNIEAKIKEAAAHAGGHVPYRNMQELLQLPASFQTKGTSWRVFLHVPVIKEHLRLYKYVPVPIFASPPGQTVPQVVLFTPSRELLLIAKDDSVHRETTREELESKCHLFHNNFLCQDLGVFRRRPESTCLGSLFSNLPASALANCPLTRMSEDWAAIPAANDRIILFSKRERNIDILCDNGTRTNHLAKGTEELHLDSGCSISSPDFVMRRGSTVDLTMRIVQQVQWNQTALAAVWTDLREQEERLQRAPPRVPPVDLPVTDEDDDWMTTTTDPRSPEGRALILGLLAATGILLVALIGTLAFLGWRFYHAGPAAQVGDG